MKKVLRILAALLATAAAALLVKLAAEVMGECSHKYIDVDEN